mmetsp:Transcript_13430/g.50314  ORF Transcript_13430/g.50314 Transcript_13430/m.50314 type:complete len:249 (+) Transcript_13430:501-1247(+)
MLYFVTRSRSSGITSSFQCWSRDATETSREVFAESELELLFLESGFATFAEGFPFPFLWLERFCPEVFVFMVSSFPPPPPSPKISAIKTSSSSGDSEFPLLGLTGISLASFTSRIFSTAVSGLQNTGCCSTSNALGRSFGSGCSMSCSTTLAAATVCLGSLLVSSALREKFPRIIRWFSYKPAIPAASGSRWSQVRFPPKFFLPPLTDSPSVSKESNSSLYGLAAPVNVAYIRLPSAHTSTALVNTEP